MKIYFCYLLIQLLIFININFSNEEEVDECLYAIQRKKECFKIPINAFNESCCYLEMDLNQITTTVCIRVKDNKEEIEKRIFQIKENEEYYKLENLNILCLSNYIIFSILIIILIVLLF